MIALGSWPLIVTESPMALLIRGDRWLPGSWPNSNMDSSILLTFVAVSRWNSCCNAAEMCAVGQIPHSALEVYGCNSVQGKISVYTLTRQGSVNHFKMKGTVGINSAIIRLYIHYGDTGVLLHVVATQWILLSLFSWLEAAPLLLHAVVLKKTN